MASLRSAYPSMYPSCNVDISPSDCMSIDRARHEYEYEMRMRGRYPRDREEQLMRTVDELQYRLTGLLEEKRVKTSKDKLQSLISYYYKRN